MFDPSKAPPLIDLAAVHGEEAERMILQCPDLQVLPYPCHTQRLAFSISVVFYLMADLYCTAMQLQYTSDCECICGQAACIAHAISILWANAHLGCPI